MHIKVSVVVIYYDVFGFTSFIYFSVSFSIISCLGMVRSSSVVLFRGVFWGFFTCA